MPAGRALNVFEDVFATFSAPLRLAVARPILLASVVAISLKPHLIKSPYLAARVLTSDSDSNRLYVVPAACRYG
jgi:hypothetical protein